MPVNALVDQLPHAVLFFTLVLLTDGCKDPSDSHSVNDRSRIDLNSFNLCGIAAIGKILSCGGEAFLISSHFTKIACTASTFSIALSQKCSIASGNNANWCGLLATTSHISCLVHGLPVHVGHPYFAYSSKNLCRWVVEGKTLWSHFVFIRC
jgi:hypothetical protein